jgi:hypothetical protein
MKSNFEVYVYSKKGINFISNGLKKFNFDEHSFNLFRFPELPDCQLIMFEDIKGISPPQFGLFGGNMITIEDILKNPKEIPKLYLHLHKSNEENLKAIETYILLRDSIRWFSDKLDSIFSFNKLDVIFISQYQNVANSYPGGLIVIDTNFIQKHTDFLDANYLNLLLVSQMY